VSGHLDTIVRLEEKDSQGEGGRVEIEDRQGIDVKTDACNNVFRGQKGYLWSQRFRR
jgi:hypothetical protein